MDSDDLDDILFALPASQESLDDIWSDMSEDDILDAPMESEFDTRDLWSSPLLMPTATDEESFEQVNIKNAEVDHTKIKQHVPDNTKRQLRDRSWVIARIEAVLETIVDALLEESEPLKITLKSRAGLSRRRINPVDSSGRVPDPKERDINFPGSSVQEAWNFTVLLRILELIHGALIDDTIMTKRDIYYRHPDLFVKQSVVDRYVDDLACTFGITRSELHVTAAAKGLVAGNFSILRNDGHRVNGMNEKEGLLVPKIGDDDTLFLGSVRWVLVIEKEAKGYPDVASRRFLRQLTNQAPHIPMYALMDLDPDGIAILSTYKYGSYRLAHEDVASKGIPALSLPDIRWLGVRNHHISRTPTDECSTSTSATSIPQGLMKLTVRDRAKATRMLEWDLCAEDGPEQGWRRELQTMLTLNVKAEMQILDELPGGLVSWLSYELEQAVGQVPELPRSSSSDDGLLF
ncbi:DNA topoisomerase IV, alpha subunit [Dothidotthia symphoricarpi CBS 119687]|uniref:DNA topoisomerase (ATP-hydrolyzing) n=1 Tax=Dothidotthia symphoricarpi CBS 119687 TaxID=1392245 RepID=A0A6A6A0M1_9PLEO|nr:DNA topoisomerase IV, alpha subunit [Dothidotthia symphoricarpi CBS 119687]KAF2125542.1 DNA topoisomerase IV, alpha subunit [Dothidotthia symphoricarpi CBS 119687]